MSASAKRGHCKAESKSTHKRSLEDETTEVVKCVTAIVLRVLSKGRTGRRAPSLTLCHHIALDGPLGTQ